MIAQHSSATVEHYTPPGIIEAARYTMRAIDLDPASTFDVNTSLVKAKGLYTKEQDGLSQEWHGNVWLNPPGGKIKNKSKAAIWWNKLAEEYVAGRVHQAIFLGFTLEILATTQDAPIWPGYQPFCIPRRRIQFLKPDLSPGDSPTHSNIIIFLPPHDETCGEAINRFQEAYGAIGRCT